MKAERARERLREIDRAIETETERRRDKEQVPRLDLRDLPEGRLATGLVKLALRERMVHLVIVTETRRSVPCEIYEKQIFQRIFQI